MSPAIVTDLLRSRIRFVTSLLGGLVLASVGYLALYSSIEAQLEAFVGDLPDVYRAFIGDADIATPEGYVRSQVLSLVGPLLVSAVAIASGAVLARTERDRTLMGTLLSPAPRRALVLSHAAYVLLVAATGGAVVVLAILGGAPLAGADLSVAAVLGAALHVAALGAATGLVALAAGAATGSPGAAMGAGWGVVVVGFLANSVGELTAGLSWLTDVSPWGWYGSGAALQEGVDGGGIALLSATGAVALAVAVWSFTRRDLQV